MSPPKTDRPAGRAAPASAPAGAPSRKAPAAPRPVGHGFQVEAGQTVQVEGSVVAVAEAPDAAAGVEESEGLSQLQQQGALVSADSVTLG